ncbi:TetR/AcrR family transcriptional regulator [Dyella tabacisoli]|uniref:TetR/AcrR family transcriptional regulator n=1 Tax=Dyella tabacisoli TaxID=2282381 RepID=A0A369UIC8_9GAMM|nr:TetR/AcrR family transcriptional regulator [Dyella tabacisoli]RDD79865.1 TetR/AcrR family transcriptional regulator [Dyella tabacisoli]
MPYTTEHKQKTRDRIVECARELFNRKGFVSVSIDEIMGHAGLTRGGFYNHFKTKEDLFAEAVIAFQNFNPADRWEGLDFDPTRCGKAHAKQMIQAYLSRSHLDDIDGHCPMIALPSDAARASPRVKQAYFDLLVRMAGIFADGLPPLDNPDDMPKEKAHQRGLALTALCVGGMVLARTFDDAAFRNEIREATQALALELIG